MIVNNANLTKSEEFQEASYKYNNNTVEILDNVIKITPVQSEYKFKTTTKVPKLGVMLVGWGGNNGTTFTGGLLANKYNIQWHNKEGLHSPNFYGSITQCSTAKVGVCKNKEIYMPLNKILPTINPTDIVVSGWDISKLNLGDALTRAQVFDYDLVQQLKTKMSGIVPLPSIYYKDFIASNQESRADNVIPGDDKWAHLEIIRSDIRNFKQEHKLDKVIVLWTANTERFCAVNEIHQTADNLLAAIKRSEQEVSASTVYACATILEGCSYINGSPQNTFVPGVIELARRHNVFIVGDDFKSGQTKIKTSLTDFLVSAGIKPRSIVSYNHLGNNDGKNLAEQKTFRSKELSKKSCVDDILQSNTTLYPESAKIDHEIVIKYVPYTGDSKKAMDEYCSDIFMGGKHSLVLYNVCEDSLLAAPIILDLILITEIFERIEYKIEGKMEYSKFDNVLSQLGYLCKAPLTTSDQPLVNSLFRQKQALDNMFKVCAGIPLDDNLLLEFRAACLQN